MVLGSASTYARAALGGIDGRALTAGARLPVPAAGERAPSTCCRSRRKLPTGPIRAVAGPQADHFDAATLAAFCDSDYRVTAEADRMGVRLEGATLAHQGASEIVSDATVPGSIQVPGKGQPIVLLADAQTAGGYPKIGTVIGADLPRVAAARPGQLLRFAWGRRTKANSWRARPKPKRVHCWPACGRCSVGGVDEPALYASNLVSGVLDALSSEHRPLLGDAARRIPTHENQRQRRPRRILRRLDDGRGRSPAESGGFGQHRLRLPRGRPAGDAAQRCAARWPPTSVWAPTRPIRTCRALAGGR